MKVRALALMSVLSLGACGGTVLEDEAQSTDQAVIGKNGIKVNGIKVNGIKVNGIKVNGDDFGAVQVSSGVTYNGMKLSGVPNSAYYGKGMTSVRLDKATLYGTLPNGQTVSGKSFLGATFNIKIQGSSSTMRVGIAEVKTTTDAEVLHYRLKIWDGSSWYATCDGSGYAVPVAGYWNSTGAKVASSSDVTFACVDSGAVGKCVMMGYKPWANDAHHQACVRMVRADYCGNGTSYTADGNVINVYDSKGIQKDDHLSQTSYNWMFDAEWGPNGAICASKAGRPNGSDIPCFVNFACDSTPTFRNGALIKNWTSIGTQYQSSSTDSNNNNFNYDIDTGGSTGNSFGGWASFFGG